jgi:hypothetical protein
MPNPSNTISKMTDIIKFRFTYSLAMYDLLNDFATIHRFDSTRQQFKEAWVEWIKEHKAAIDNQTELFESQGFTGNILDKMYKSVRYYYRQKPFHKKEPVKRTSYTTIPKLLLAKIDEHCTLCRRNQKPQDAFEAFLDSNSDTIDAIKRHLANMENEDIDKKIKKTYKNRYYKI